MKKIFTLLFAILLISSCSTKTDTTATKTNSTPTDIPKGGPVDFNCIVASPTQAYMLWTGNSMNHTGFKIERKTESGVFTVIGTTAKDSTTFNDLGLSPNTSYIYRVCSYNSGGNSKYSNECFINTSQVLAVATSITSAIATSNVISGGEVIQTYAQINNRGVVWSTNTNPTIALSTKTNNGTDVGTYISNVKNLKANTKYYIRAYATNLAGTVYGNEESFTTTNPISDFDGNVYETVNICNQNWMQSNLQVSHYRNGDVIPEVKDPTAWSNLTTGTWCYYNNNNSPEKLYNWYAVNDSRGLAPIGFHVPTSADWNTLATCLGGANIAGGKMKAINPGIGGIGWWLNESGATNSSGFYAKSYGERNYYSTSTFQNIKLYGFWWASDLNSAGLANYVYIHHLSTSIESNSFAGFKNGYSVRCIKD
ncbi:MAG: hypothetical protein K9G64_05170 [Bacteroidia bacterium]|nr:hypothetical protein [Bacteroidia bacterium]